MPWPGLTAEQLDAIGRGIINAAGYGEHPHPPHRELKIV